MRKLFLASVNFGVGEVKCHEYRLVAADIPSIIPDTGTNQLNHANRVGMDAWLREAEGTERKLHEFIVNHVLTEEPKEFKVAPVFDAWYGINEFPEKTVEDEDVSHPVLIDLNGDKTRYAIGFYAFHPVKRWCLNSFNRLDAIHALITSDMKWRKIY